jgi:hypothetical protein
MRRSATALACAALVACVACGKSDETTTQTGQQRTETGTASSETTSARADTGGQQQAQQVTFEGCMQKAAGTFGSDYVLTMLNEPPGAAGTSGSVTKTGSSVEREQMRMAARTYRLEAKGDVKLDDMVGKQVRVTGVISEQAHVPTGAGAIGTSLDTQQPNRDRTAQDERGAELKTSELGKVDVSSATVIAQSCGAQGRETSGRTSSGMAGTDRTPRTK